MSMWNKTTTHKTLKAAQVKVLIKYTLDSFTHTPLPTPLPIPASLYTSSFLNLPLHLQTVQTLPACRLFFPDPIPPWPSKSLAYLPSLPSFLTFLSTFKQSKPYLPATSYFLYPSFLDLPDLLPAASFLQAPSFLDLPNLLPACRLILPGPILPWLSSPPPNTRQPAYLSAIKLVCVE